MNRAKLWTLFMGAALVFGTSAQAKVSQQEAARLGQDLTPMGAERAGNADGSIPEWTGGIQEMPAGYKRGEFLPDPFAGDQVQFTITAANASQYADKLSPGQMAMLQKYPNTFKMNVYPTRRSASFPQFVYDAVRKNATSAEMTPNFEGVNDAIVGPAFPIPQNGQEVLWNHLLRYVPRNQEFQSDAITPTASGSFIDRRIRVANIRPYAELGIKPGATDTRIGVFIQQNIAPAFAAGLITLIYEELNADASPRQAWQYSPGTRRVRVAPNIAFDNTVSNTDGQQLIDQVFLFNGAKTRYDVKLVGKRELYVPYNAYRMYSSECTPDALGQVGHINPDFARYELHRVWEIELTLKSGASHLISRRTLFLDEDSWYALIGDMYDQRGNLFQLQEAHVLNFYDAKFVNQLVETIYDMSNGRYNVTGIPGNVGPADYFTELDEKDFSPAALRRAGRR